MSRMRRPADCKFTMCWDQTPVGCIKPCQGKPNVVAQDKAIHCVLCKDTGVRLVDGFWVDCEH